MIGSEWFTFEEKPWAFLNQRDCSLWLWTERIQNKEKQERAVHISEWTVTALIPDKMLKAFLHFVDLIPFFLSWCFHLHLYSIVDCLDIFNRVSIKTIFIEKRQGHNKL